MTGMASTLCSSAAPLPLPVCEYFKASRVRIWVCAVGASRCGLVVTKTGKKKKNRRSGDDRDGDGDGDRRGEAWKARRLPCEEAGTQALVLLRCSVCLQARRWRARAGQVLVGTRSGREG